VANTPQAKKRAKQAEKNRQHNMGLRSKIRTMIKKILKAVQDKNLEAAKATYKEAVPTIDRMVPKGILKKNTAARYKSRLNARIKKLAGS